MIAVASLMEMAAVLIPEDIDRGALSEDGIYDLLTDQKNVEDILQQIQEYLQEN